MNNPILIAHEDPDNITEFDVMIGDDKSVYIRFPLPSTYENIEDYANHLVQQLTFLFYQSKVHH